jgi:hypothetical protein
MGATMDCKCHQLCSRSGHSLEMNDSCENIVLWRGHFNATGAEKSVNLSINGGQGSSLFYGTDACH